MNEAEPGWVYFVAFHIDDFIYHTQPQTAVEGRNVPERVECWPKLGMINKLIKTLKIQFGALCQTSFPSAFKVFVSFPKSPLKFAYPKEELAVAGRALV